MAATWGQCWSGLEWRSTGLALINLFLIPLRSSSERTRLESCICSYNKYLGLDGCWQQPLFSRSHHLIKEGFICTFSLYSFFDFTPDGI